MIKSFKVSSKGRALALAAALIFSTQGKSALSADQSAPPQGGQAEISSNSSPATGDGQSATVNDPAQQQHQLDGSSPPAVGSQSGSGQHNSASSASGHSSGASHDATAGSNNGQHSGDPASQLPQGADASDAAASASAAEAAAQAQGGASLSSGANPSSGRPSDRSSVTNDGASGAGRQNRR